MVVMVNKKTKTVKVDQSTATEWDEYVAENPEIDSVSHLIRLAVQKETSGAYDIENRHETNTDNQSVSANGEVLTHLRQIQTAVSDVEERVSAIEETESAEASYSLQKAIYAVLSECHAPKGLPEEEYRTDPDVLSSRELAKKLDAKIGEVDEAIDRMDDDSDLINVKRAENGEKYVWKVPK